MTDDWGDLYERLTKAEQELAEMAHDAFWSKGNVKECERLTAKREGVSLAVDYMRGYGR